MSCAHCTTANDAPVVPIAHDLVAAVAWCRLGSSRTPKPWPTDEAFRNAEKLGLLRHHPTWHATPEGEGVLVAAGLLEGNPAPDLTTVHVLWARADRYPASFVAAFSDGLVECLPDLYERQRLEAEQSFKDHAGVDVVEFFTTVEHLAEPEDAA